MVEKKNKRNRSYSSSSSVGVSIVAFLLGFLFAFLVLIGGIFGVGYVAVTTDINEVLRVLGLENVKENPESDNDKYNYINADTAPNLLALIGEITNLANSGLGEINLNKIDALAPVTETVLNFAYDFIDGVVDFDKEYFQDVPLTSIIDCVTNSVYYVHTAKMIDLLNNKMGYSIDLSGMKSADYLVNGVEAQYATVKVGDKVVENFRLPVLFDYYVCKTLDGQNAYFRTEEVKVGNKVDNSFPSNLSTEYVCETMSKDSGDNKLYKVYYVPCKVTDNGIEEAEYKVVPNVVEDPNVTYTKDGETFKLKYVFNTISYGDDTEFIAVKPEIVDGEEQFVLDHSAIKAAKNDYSYYAPYAENYYSGPEASESNERLYGVSTINGINYFKDNAGNVIDYDPLTVSDLMIDPTATLDYLPISSVVNDDQRDTVRGVFGDTSLGAILKNQVTYNTLINEICLSTFMSDVDVTDKVMAFIVYNISDIKKDESGNYTATYHGDGKDESVKLTVVEGKIKSITDGNGKELEGHNVADLTTITLDLTLDIFMDVKADDAIMSYLGYGVTNVVEVSGKDWKYEGTYGEGAGAKTVRIYTDTNKIITKVTDTDGKEIGATTVNEVGQRVDNVMNVLTLPDVIDIDPTSAIMAYIGYGITEVEEVAGKDYAYTGMCDDKTVYIYVDANKKISKVTYTDGKLVSGTAIDKVGEKVDKITDVLTLADFIDIEADNAIMSYVGFSIYDVCANGGTNGGKAYTHTATYKQDGTEVTVFVATETKDGKTYINSVWQDGGAKVKGTKINDISGVMDNLTDSIAITEFLDIDPEDAIMAYMAYGVTGVVAVAESNSDSLGNAYAFKADYEGKTCYMTVDADNKVTDIWYIEGGAKVTVKGTKIGAVPDRINTLQDKLTIGEIITVDSSSTMILQAIKDTTISGLDERINELTVSDVLTEEQINNNSVLPQLKDSLITELGSAIDEVLIQDIYLDNVYKDVDEDGVIELLEVGTDIAFDPAYLYYEKVDDGNGEYEYVLVDKNCEGKTGTEYDNALGKLTQDDWDNRGDKVYYTYGEATGMWKLVLYRLETDELGNKVQDAEGNYIKTEKAYTLNNFDNMVNACSDTVYNSTLGDLQEAEIIESTTNLDKYMKFGSYYITIGADGAPTTTPEQSEAKKMSQLTLKQLLDTVIKYMASDS